MCLGVLNGTQVGLRDFNLIGGKQKKKKKKGRENLRIEGAWAF